ncbi:MAG TPA: DUF5668 domain-containing protein [Candidatus Dormibacteraeota bacterium]
MWNRGPSIFWGGVLVVLGLLFLLANTGILENVNWDYVWPVLLIALGLWLLAARIGPGGATADVDSAEPREELSKAKLEIAVGSGRIEVRSASIGDELYKTHIEHGGTAPEVRLDRASGTVRISQRPGWFAGARRLRIDTQVTEAIPWEVSCSTGAIRGEFDFSMGELSAFECRTGASQIDLNLGTPKGNVPIRIEGGALTVNIVRAAGAAIGVQASGGAVQIQADGAHLDGIGSREWRSHEFDAAVDGYDVTVQGGALKVNVSTR